MHTHAMSFSMMMIIILLPWASFICTYFAWMTKEFKLHLGEYNEDDEGVIHFKLSEPITHHPYPFAPKAPNYVDAAYFFDSAKIVMNSRSRSGFIFRPHFDSFHFISCNGLIFTGSMMSDEDMLYVYNPFTREYVDLLPSFVSSGISSEMKDQPCFIANGFGYNDSTNEYKIVRICHHNCSYSSAGVGHASVYTLGSGKWRSKGKIILSMSNGGPNIGFGKGPGVFANGAIYWLDTHDTRSLNAKILSFDLGDEKFSFVPEEALQEICFRELGVLRGNLCVTSPQDDSSDIWIAKNKNKVWTRKFNVPWGYDLLQNELVAISKGGKILLHSNCDGRLFSYDPKTESLSGIENAPALNKFHIIPYTKSFVSLKGLGEEDAKCMDMPTSSGSRTERGESSNGGEGPINVQREDRGVQRGGKGRGRGRGRGRPIPPAEVLRPPWRVPGSSRGHFGGGGAINTTGGNTGRGQMAPIGVNRSTWRGRGNGSSNTGRGNRSN